MSSEYFFGIRKTTSKFDNEKPLLHNAEPESIYALSYSLHPFLFIILYILIALSSAL